MAQLGSLPQKTELLLQDLSVPEETKGPYVCKWVIPEGRIRAILIDASSGRTVAETTPWRIRLKDMESNRIFMSYKKDKTGPWLDIPHLPTGRFQLEVQALPYVNFNTRAFSLEEGQDLDLGELSLEPAGILAVHVEGVNGRALHGISYHFQTPSDWERPRRYKPEGKSVTSFDPPRCFSVPLPGPVRLTVGSRGCFKKKITVQVPAGGLVEVEVTLEPDPYGRKKF
jgi:hypothetical protein